MFLRQVYLPAALTIAASTAHAQMQDCDYTASLYGAGATLQVKGGQPVAYRWRNYVASNVNMQGDTVFIDAATLSNVVAGKSNKGNWVIKGDWKLGSRRKNNVIFTCR